MKKLNKRKTRLLRVLSVALVFVVCSVYAIVGVNAKYKTEATATSTAQVAKFNIVNIGSTPSALEIESVTFNLYDADQLSKEINFEIASNSEVSVGYDVIVTLPASSKGDSWLTTSLGVSDYNGTLYSDITTTDIETITVDEIPVSYIHTYSFDDFEMFNFEPLDPRSHSFVLTIAVDSVFHGNEALLGDISDLPFEIKVHAEQID